MKKGLILPVLALALVAGACDEDGDTTGVDAQTRVRFVNAVNGFTGNLALTADGTVVGSPLTYGSTSGQCTTVDAGSSTLAFGTANAGGTGISGTALSTQSTTFASGGSYTVIATGTSASPGFVVLNNNAYGSAVASGQTAVRFVNLVPSLTGGASSTLNVYTGTTTTGTPTSSNLTFGGTSNFTTMNSGSTTFTFTNAAGTTVYSNTGSGLNLQSGTVNTVAILPNATGTGYQLINLTACQ